MATISSSVETATTSTINRINTSLMEKIESLTNGSLPYYRSLIEDLLEANKQNAEILCDFLLAQISGFMYDHTSAYMVNSCG